MPDDILSRDDNRVPVLGAITDDANQFIRQLEINDTTKRLKVSATFPGNTDGKIKISSDDTTFGYAEDKLVAGTGITLTVNNPGANETITISAPGGATDEQVAVDSGATAGYLGALSSDGVLRTNNTITYTDGGNFITLSVNEGNLDLANIGGSLDLSTQVTGQLDATNIDESSLNLANIGGTLNLSTQVTGTLDGANIDQSSLTLSTIGGTLDLTSQVTGILPLANGGTGSNLSDPGADRILFWDDSASTVTWLTAGSGLSISGTTMTATGSTTASATTTDVNQTAHGLSVGDVVRSSGVAGEYTKAQADSESNSNVVGIVTTVTDVDNFTITTHGEVTAAVPTQSAGTVMYLSESSAGTLTTTEPSSSGEISKPLVVIIESGTRMMFINMRGEEVGASVSDSYGDQIISLGTDSVSGAGNVAYKQLTAWWNDGQDLFLVFAQGMPASGGGAAYRLTRDGTTGNFYLAQASASGAVQNTFDTLSTCCIVGNTMYLSDAVNDTIYRYDKTTLAYQGAAIISGGTLGAPWNITTDGTDILAKPRNTSSATWTRYTISGATLTQGSTVVGSTNFTSEQLYFDGTDYWSVPGSSAARKYDSSFALTAGPGTSYVGSTFNLATSGPAIGMYKLSSSVALFSQQILVGYQDTGSLTGVSSRGVILRAFSLPS